MSEIRIADLFAGIGGIRMGMVQALGDAAHVVYSSEWNKYSVQTYEANWHDENPVAGDITKVDEHDVPDIDLLLAGFPCQPFSIAGVSKKQSMAVPPASRTRPKAHCSSTWRESSRRSSRRRSSWRT